MGAQESAFLLFTKKRITSAFGTLQLILSLYKNYKKYFLACLLHLNGWKMHQEAFFIRNLIIFTLHSWSLKDWDQPILIKWLFLYLCLSTSEHFLVSGLLKQTKCYFTLFNTPNTNQRPPFSVLSGYFCNHYSLLAGLYYFNRLNEKLRDEACGKLWSSVAVVKGKSSTLGTIVATFLKRLEAQLFMLSFVFHSILKFITIAQTFLSWKLFSKKEREIEGPFG